MKKLLDDVSFTSKIFGFICISTLYMYVHCICGIDTLSKGHSSDLELFLVSPRELFVKKKSLYGQFIFLYK